MPTDKMRTLDAIRTEFNNIDFNEAILLTFAFRDFGDQHQIAFDIDLAEYDPSLRNPSGTYSWSYKPITLTFLHCFIVGMEIDAIFGHAAGHTMDTGNCSALEEWKWTLVEMHPDSDVREYLHFRLELCAPSGVVNIVAKDFRLIARA